MQDISRTARHRFGVACLLALLFGAAAGRAQETDGRPAQIAPPEVQTRVAAEYPPRALAARQAAVVELLVTVAVDGTTRDIEVAVSGGLEFDQAAIAAVQAWQFLPAKRNGKPISARIRVPVRFEPPPEPRAPGPPSAPRTPLPTPDSAAVAETTPAEVTVRGTGTPRAELRATGDFRVARDQLEAAPRQEGADVLTSVPGLYIGRGEGAGVAHNYMLRGFDAEHGQDIEFRVGGLPINLRSHIHGQGYTDLGFLIASTVRELRVSEGVYDPRQGDFAVAGSIDVVLGVEERDRGIRVDAGIGRFGTRRQLVLWAPRDEAVETFGAVQHQSTAGFGERRVGESASGIFQKRFGQGDLTYRAIGVLYTARSEFAGVVRRDDVEAGRVCLVCAYPQATAQAQNALANRFLAGVFADQKSPSGASGQLGFWLGYDNFRLQENFTGFLQRSRELSGVAGRGDLIEQRNRTFSLGLTGHARTSPMRLTTRDRGTLEVGAEGRLDVIDQEQNLLDASARRQTWDRRVDASIRGADLGFWGDLDWHFRPHLRVRLGLRADVLSYDVDDRLGNFAPRSRPQSSFIAGFRRSAMGYAWGPRTSVEVRPVSWVSLLAAYGEGYRSPQARLLEDGERAPFSKVRSADAGVRFDWSEPLTLMVGGYYTHLSDDVAFDAEEGRPEPIGATERVGAVLHALTRPLEGLIGSLSVTTVRATLLEPPPGTAEEPQPQFEPGQRLPYVPPVVIRADVGVRRTLVANAGGKVLSGKVGLGFSYLSPRPLPHGDFSEPVALADASAGLGWGPLRLNFELYNALNSDAPVVEYSFPSDWDPDGGPRSRTPARHVAARAPTSWMASLGVTL